MSSDFDVDPSVTGKLTCGSLRADNAGESVTLQGWVNRRRDLGGLIFIDLRDRYGLTQIVMNPEVTPESHAVASDLRNEDVIRVSGTVRARPSGTENPKLETGEIEVEASQIDVLNRAQTPPFNLNEDAEVDESLRLQYRYLDLRRPRMQRNVILRHRVVKQMRDYLDQRGFLEIETPLLIKSTPEGARDFLVPSSGFPGNFYALPQSPQQLKQLLMIAGYDRYFQIARCFRDEPLRADRQPEFTQLDIEMAFVQEADIMDLIEELYIQLSETFSPKRIAQRPFPRLTYAEAMDRYGSDRPDTRFGLELHDVSGALAGTGFRAFAEVLAGGGQVKAIVAPDCAVFIRREIEDLTELAKKAGAKGLATIALTDEGVKSPIAKFLNESELTALTTGIGAHQGDLVLIVADKPTVVAKALSALREELRDRLHLADPEMLAFCWVYEFPLLEWDEDNQRWDATHNPFCGFYEEDRHLLANEPGSVRSKQYDLTCNGWELGGGSVRNHKRADQELVFGLMGHDPAAQHDRFGAILDALEFGAPPHGGIAMGLDRTIMLFSNETSIREVVAFPKNQRGADLMFDAPTPVPTEALDDVGLALKPDVEPVT